MLIFTRLHIEVSVNLIATSNQHSNSHIRRINYSYKGQTSTLVVAEMSYSIIYESLKKKSRGTYTFLLA